LPPTTTLIYVPLQSKDENKKMQQTDGIVRDEDDITMQMFARIILPQLTPFVLMYSTTYTTAAITLLA